VQATYGRKLSPKYVRISRRLINTEEQYAFFMPIHVTSRIRYICNGVYTCFMWQTFSRNILITVYYCVASRDSSASAATGYEPSGRNSIPESGKTFRSSTVSRPTLGATQHHIQWVPARPFLSVKRQGREADHSPPSSAEVKNLGLYSHSPIYFLGVLA
jgi:hypothetical protein